MYLLIGANGQLATDIRKVFPVEQLIPLTHQDLEITDPEQVGRIISEIRPEVVINTAAYHRVDEMEENVLKALEVNAVGVHNLARACKENGAVLVHLSTDYIFDGEKGSPYYEEDPPRPINVYGLSKLAGEYLLQSTWEKHFLLRTSGLFGVAGSSSKGGNFVETMLRLAREKPLVKVVNDQTLSLTYTLHLARKIWELVQTDEYGLYHVTGNGWCSWYEFAKTIFEITGIWPKEFLPQSTAESGAKAQRPRFSALAHGHLQALGMDDMPTWRQGLLDYLSEREKVKGKL